jgi:hypothetical protein
MGPLGMANLSWTAHLPLTDRKPTRSSGQVGTACLTVIVDIVKVLLKVLFVRLTFQTVILQRDI